MSTAIKKKKKLLYIIEKNNARFFKIKDYNTFVC